LRPVVISRLVSGVPDNSKFRRTTIERPRRWSVLQSLYLIWEPFQKGGPSMETATLIRFVAVVLAVVVLSVIIYRREQKST
jgi:hypothetical protein